MSTSSDALGAAIDSAVTGLSAGDQAIALKCWKAMAGALLGTSLPGWLKFTVTYDQLAAASTSNNIEIYSLPAGGVIHATKIKHSASFTGAPISAYVISIGIVGTLNKYGAAYDVFQAPGNTAMQLQGTLGTENHGAATSIRAAATSTGANLNVAGAGSCDLWLLVSVAT